MQRAGISFLPYVSSHGTGTPLGDPIETGALRKAIAQGPLGHGPTQQVFTLGAVKSLTGHLEGTAGLAGLMLCTLQLQQRSNPPLRYRNLNPYVGESLAGWGGHRLPIQASPAVEPDQAMPCAGTSSFSMSGVNAHAIISAPVPADARRSVVNHWRRDDLFSAAVILQEHPFLTRAAPQVQLVVYCCHVLALTVVACDLLLLTYNANEAHDTCKSYLQVVLSMGVSYMGCRVQAVAYNVYRVSHCAVRHTISRRCAYTATCMTVLSPNCCLLTMSCCMLVLCCPITFGLSMCISA